MICVCPTMGDTSIDAHFGQEKVPHRQTNPCQIGFDQYSTMIHLSRYQTMVDLWRNGTPSPNISEPNPTSQCYQTTTPSGVGQRMGLWSNPGCSFQMPIAATCSVLVPCWWILPAHHKNVASWTDRQSMRLLRRLNYDTTKTRVFQCFETKPASNFCTRFIKPLSDESSALDVQAHVIPEAHEGHFSFTKSCQCETTHKCMFPVHPNTHTHTHTKQIKTSKAQHSNARSEWFCAKGFQTMQQTELSTLMSVLSIVKCWFALFLQISLLQLSLSHDCFGKNTWHIEYGYIWCIWVNAQRVFTLEFLSSSYMPMSFMRLKKSVGNPIGNALSWRVYVLHVVFEFCVFARSWYGVRDQGKKTIKKK